MLQSGLSFPYWPLLFNSITPCILVLVNFSLQPPAAFFVLLAVAYNRHAYGHSVLDSPSATFTFLGLRYSALTTAIKALLLRTVLERSCSELLTRQYLMSSNVCFLSHNSPHTLPLFSSFTLHTFHCREFCFISCLSPLRKFSDGVLGLMALVI